MRPARFHYRAPETLAEVLDALAADPDETSVLAGGQSLVPMLNMRLARPEVVLDLRRVDELAGIERVNGHLRFGAMTRQRAIERDERVRAALPLVPAALSHVAHTAIRTRGTIGGSLAHADPSAELPAVAVALEARLHVRARDGARTVAAEDFFVAPLMTALEPGELIEAIEIPIPPPRTGHGFHEVAATHGAFALAGAAAVVRLAPTGAVEHARLVLMGMSGTPLMADLSALAGRPCDEDALAEVRARLQDELQPVDDAHASAAYRRRAGAAVAVRALREAARMAREEQA